METIKTNKADIEQYRPMAFLIGFVVALSLLFVALEFSYSIIDDDTADDSDNDFIEELEIQPVMPVQNMVALKEKSSEAQSEKIVVAEDNTAVPDETVKDPSAGSGGEDAGEETAQETAPETAVSPIAVDKDNPLNFHVMEELPQFPGGAVEMMKWLTKNLKYPEGAQRRKKQGRVVVQFDINTNGKVSDIKIIKSIDPQLDREALRVIRMMPDWKPGMQNDKPCRTRVVVPVWFRL
ncbi:MAG: energy transducer TonB [Prevotella sp.]|nr:energy transducer TonB [Prevotella sp.]MBO5156692.1 energy transducer TonB [Prevotella sp.]